MLGMDNTALLLTEKQATQTQLKKVFLATTIKTPGKQKQEVTLQVTSCSWLCLVTTKQDLSLFFVFRVGGKIEYQGVE